MKSSILSCGMVQNSFDWIGRLTLFAIVRAYRGQMSLYGQFPDLAEGNGHGRLPRICSFLGMRRGESPYSSNCRPYLACRLQTLQGRCSEVFPYSCVFSFFFGLFGVDEVVEGEGGVVGHVTEGVGELFVVKGIDVANDVVGEADYLLDVLV